MQISPNSHPSGERRRFTDHGGFSEFANVGLLSDVVDDLGKPVDACRLMEVAGAIEQGPFNTSVRQNIEEESTDEFLCGKCHRFSLTVVFRILVPEAISILFNFQQAIVGDGYAMGVAADVIEHFSVPLFHSRRDGPIKNPRNWFATALEQAKIKGVTWHKYRHIFASRLAMYGVNLKTVQELMGHKAIAMTARFAHLAPTHKLQALETLVCPGPVSVQSGFKLAADAKKSRTAKKINMLQTV